MGEEMFSKEQILSEILRCAEDNDGVPLGRSRFAAVTGIKQSDWLGRYWARWSDAVTEAGFAPNEFQGARSEGALLVALAHLTRTLGHFPTYAELKMQRRQDSRFPSAATFNRLGNRSERVVALREHCEGSSNYADVLVLLGDAPTAASSPDEPERADSADPSPGVVYLLKVGKHYKIGRTNDASRRSREINLQLPEAAERIHAIRTDDAVGIERYWHQRFADRRLNGEWFLLSKADVAAFKRWKTI